METVLPGKDGDLIIAVDISGVSEKREGLIGYLHIVFKNAFAYIDDLLQRAVPDYGFHSFEIPIVDTYENCLHLRKQT